MDYLPDSVQIACLTAENKRLWSFIAELTRQIGILSERLDKVEQNKETGP